MTPAIGLILGPVVDFVLGKLKEGKAVEVKEVIENLGPTLSAVEDKITDAAKEQWLADLHNGGWMATSWRPLAALVSIGGLAWEGFVLPVANTMVTIPYPPEYISQAFLYTLLTLIGARGIEKINIARRR